MPSNEITDIHCHFIPEEFFSFVRKNSEFEVHADVEKARSTDVVCRGTKYRLNSTFFDPELQMVRLDQLGIDRAVVSLATPLVNYYVEPKLAIQAARICNDGFASLIGANDKRFSAWALLPMQDPHAAAAELRRCVREFGFIGGHVATSVRGTYLSDEMFDPVFHAANELDVPLFLHPADPPGQDRSSEYELTVVAGYLFESTINILRMICSNFFERHHSAKLVCAHTGAFSLMLRNRMQREVDTNALLSASLAGKVGDYLQKFYFDTICFEPGYLRLAADLVPPEQFLLGSDGPFPLGEPDPVNFVRNALPRDHAELALGANFRRLVGE